MEAAAARPVIVPDTIVIDGGRVFISETFTRACARLGISVQRARPRTPTDKSVAEATFGSVKTPLAQHLACYTGRNPDRRGDRVAEQAAWTVPDLQDLLDEWLVIWQNRPHDALRDPLFPRRAISPNQKYAALVAAAGYLPVPLTAEDYLELLPVTWRVINDYGIRIDYRTYDHADLASWRRQHSGITARKGLWEVHYDPYDLSRVFVRTPAGWVTAPWTHLPMVSAPFADFTGGTPGSWPQPGDWTPRTSPRSPGCWTTCSPGPRPPPVRGPAPASRPGPRSPRRTAPPCPQRKKTGTVTAGGSRSPPPAQQPAVPMGIFDARAEAKKWR